jgi:hypothetical protein
MHVSVYVAGSEHGCSVAATRAFVRVSSLHQQAAEDPHTMVVGTVLVVS